MSMTDNAANVAMCNESLGLIGAEAISVGSGSEQNHVICTTFFDASRDETLSFHKWNKAKKRAFAVQTTKPIFGAENAFTYPTDSIKIWMIEEDALAKFEVEGELILTDEGQTPQGWSTATDYVEGEYVSDSDITYSVDQDHTSDTIANDVIAGNLTSLADDLQILAIEYVYQRTDVDAWPEYMRRANVINLASKIISPIKQDMEAAEELQGMLHGSRKTIGYLDVARSIDAQEQGGVVIRTNTFLKARRAGRLRLT